MFTCRFKALFSKDQDGLPINWKSLTPEKIGERYKAVKKEVEDTLNDVKNFTIKGSSLDLGISLCRHLITIFL